MEYIKLFEDFDDKNNFLPTEIGDQLKELWNELKEPLENLNSNINDYQIHPNLHGVKDNYRSIDEIYKFELVSRITRIIEKMKKICKDNGDDKSLYSSISGISYVIPEDWQSDRTLNQDDIDRFSIGYKAYKELGEVIKTYKKPVEI